jgi:signal transduction histidine kinase/ActR/RegA family two-component response regulator
MAVPSDHDIILSLGEDLPVGIWIARVPTGQEVYVNKTFAQIMGVGMLPDAKVGNYSEPYGIFTRDGKPYPEERMPFVRAMVEKTVVVVDDLKIHRPDGSRVDVRAFARPVGDPITHVIIAFHDITRECEAEAARVEADQRLQRAQRLEAIGTLAGGIAHDFNNLIFGIKLIASELATTEKDAKRKSALTLIDEITERSAALTRSLLGFARRGKHRAVPLSLEDVITAMAELLKRTLSGVTLEFDLHAEDRGTVLGDQSQIEQVILNLIVNARDAVRGSGHVRVSTRTVTTAAAGGRVTAGTGRYVLLEVLDNGPGIPASLRERVFEPYFTTKTKGPERGTGLGLATVLGIAESHGGSCEITDGPDGGTAMRVYLPTTDQATQSPIPPVQTTAPTGSGLVLVVDDDPVVRRAVASALGNLGYQTVEAENGVDAVEIYRAHRDELLAVVLDMVMPGMNGRATYLALRAIAPDVAVVLMSGYTLNEEVQEILDLGVKVFVSKPYTVDALARAIAQVTGAGA